jgi:hypothetical protein
MRAGPIAAILVACTCAHAQTNPAARPNRDITGLAGGWNGAHLEQRSACNASQNNGFHGTYGDFRIYVDTVGHYMSLDETAVTGLTCSWTGNYGDDGGRTIWSGNLTCSDGRAGTFRTEGFLASLTQMQLRLSIQLTGGDRCSIDAIVSGARF